MPLTLAGISYTDLIGQTDMPKRTARSLSNIERFYTFVDLNGPIAKNRPDLGRCHIWTGGKTRGYGIFWANGTSHRAHVWIYKHTGHTVPEGLELDHFACDRTDCVNPQHVKPVTTAVNVLRSTGPTAINARVTECPAGHEYNDRNTRVNAQGSRECLECKRTAQREMKQAQRAVDKGYTPLPAGTEACSLGHDLAEVGRAFKDGTIVCLTCTAPLPGWGRPRKPSTV